MVIVAGPLARGARLCPNSQLLLSDSCCCSAPAVEAAIAVAISSSAMRAPPCAGSGSVLVVAVVSAEWVTTIGLRQAANLRPAKIHVFF